jgi:hypothetical protein
MAKKHIIPKIFAQLTQVERAIKHSTKTNGMDSQFTLLVKLGQTYNAERRLAEEKNKELKTYWRKLLGAKTDFGFFYNPEIGTIFIAGPLSELFLHDIDGKKLGALTEAPYGILRGLGISEPEAIDNIKKLNEGRYLLLVRMNRFDLKSLEDTFEKTG